MIVGLQKTHVLIDLWSAEDGVLKTVEPTRSALTAAVCESGGTILHSHFHQFQPHGFSGVYVIAESHVSVHTWVAERLMCVDILCCGSMRWRVILEALRRTVQPVKERVRRESRG